MTRKKKAPALSAETQKNMYDGASRIKQTANALIERNDKEINSRLTLIADLAEGIMQKIQPPAKPATIRTRKQMKPDAYKPIAAAIERKVPSHV